jgi:hypothetical protein
MKFTDFVPADMVPQIAEASKHDWFAAENDPDDGNHFLVRMNKMHEAALAVPLLRVLQRNSDGRGFIYLNAVCSLYRNGFKVFKPTPEQCEATEQIDLRISVGDIKAPFDTFAIDLPEAYRQGVRERYGEVPGALLFHLGTLISGEQYLVIGGPYSRGPGEEGSAEYFYVMHDGTPGQDIEAKLSRYISDYQTVIAPEEANDPAHKANEVIARMAINLCLLATHFGTTRPAESNPKHADRLRKRCPESESARQELKSMAKYFELEQNTVIREVRPASEDRGGTHSSPKPHLRRGHWRSLPGYAKLRAEGKQVPLLFIRPVMVRPEAFLGTPDKITATYRLRKKNSK